MREHTLEFGRVAVDFASLSLDEKSKILKTEGACSGLNPRMFYPSSNHTALDDLLELKAKEICAICDLTADCLQYALETHEKYGIWGGKTERERRSVIRSKQRATSRQMSVRTAPETAA